MLTPENWQELCRINALPPDQREAAFLEAAPRLGVKPGTVVPRWQWDFEERHRRGLQEAKAHPLSETARKAIERLRTKTK